MTATFTLSAFGDEISPELEEQLQTLNDLNVGYLDLRGAWGKNVLHMDSDDLLRVVKLCGEHDIQVACIGSPLGKSPIMDPIEKELDNLRKIMRVGETVGCRNIRIFSFYPPDPQDNTHHDEYVEQSVERLNRMVEVAKPGGFTLLLENEKGIVTDTLARTEKVIKAVDSPFLRALWDSANFIQEHEENVVERGWPMLGEYIGYVHIKDAVLEDGHVVAAGEGDGQIGLLLEKLKERGYQGFLALEPHLRVAGHSTGFTGPDKMAYAVNALRKIMTEVGAQETLSPGGEG